MAIRVLVFDDHPVVHFGITHQLEKNGFQVVGHAYDGCRSVEAVTEYRPDIVVIDVRMPTADGFVVLEELAATELETIAIMHSAYDNSAYVARAIALGALDYVLKNEDPDRLSRALRDAIAGASPDENSIFQRTRRLMAEKRFDADSRHSLTNRELQVLRHVGLGLSNREISNSLGISVETVKEHVQNILRKRNSKDRTEAGVWAVKNGLV